MFFCQHSLKLLRMLHVCMCVSCRASCASNVIMASTGSVRWHPIQPWSSGTRCHMGCLNRSCSPQWSLLSDGHCTAGGCIIADTICAGSAGVVLTVMIYWRHIQDFQHVCTGFCAGH